MENKKCPSCGEIKNRSEFYPNRTKRSGVSTYCRICSSKINKLYHNKNKEHMNKRSLRYSKENKESIKTQRSSKKDLINEYQRNYARKRFNSDPIFKFKKNIRRSTSEAFRLKKKSKKTLEILGCSLEEAFAHIEALFQPGMTWDNYGTEWHIDHIIPLASSDTIEKTEKLCHYSNLQPLWALENILKSDKLNWNAIK